MTSPTKVIASNVGEYYDRLLLDNLYPNLYLYQLGEKRRLPRGQGKVIHFTKYYKAGSGFAVPFAITDGTPIGLSTLSTTRVSATVAGYGSAVGVSDFIVMVGVSDVVKGAVFELSKGMALAIERQIRTTISGSGTQIGAAGSIATSMQNCGTASLINSVDLMRATANLREDNARTWPDGLYATIMHPKVAFDLRNDATAITGWADIQRQTAGGQDKIYHGEVGSLYGTRIIESSEAKQLLPPTASLYAISEQASGFVTTTIAPGAFGVVELDGAAASVYVKQVGSSGSSDAINQLGSVGVKTYFTSVVLDSVRMVRFASGGKTL
ncbi:MAG: N4-gp56 family major capsid protein [Planctomycetota bacterium]|jgi:N4-gp56 family major capsid protein